MKKTIIDSIYVRTSIFYFLASTRCLIYQMYSRHDIAEILLMLELNTNQSIFMSVHNLSLKCMFHLFDIIICHLMSIKKDPDLSKEMFATRRVPLVEQKLGSLSKHLSSSPLCRKVCVAQSVYFCVVFCRSLLVFLSFSFVYCIVCLSTYEFWLYQWYIVTCLLSIKHVTHLSKEMLVSSTNVHATEMRSHIAAALRLGCARSTVSVEWGTMWL